LWLLAATCCASCGFSVKRDEVCGNYGATYDLASEDLSLRCDGTFTQAVTPRVTGKPASSSGRWSYDPGGSRIEFESGYMTVMDGFHRFRQDFAQPENGLTSLPVIRWFEGPEIEFAEGIYYKKK
jgi:hypothetical protein